MRRRNVWTSAVLAAVITVTLLPGASASGTIEGPAYPPPGGVSFAGSGDIGRTGGATFQFSNLDMNRFDALFWGARAGSVRLAMDGTVDAPGETLSFDSASSDFGQGLIRYAGTATLPNVGTFSTRLTIVATGPDHPLVGQSASAVGIPADVGAVEEVPGDFAANLRFDVLSSGGWTPAKDFFDAAPKSPSQDGHLRLEVNGGFWYIDANDAPLASFTYSPNQPRALQAVQLQSTSSDPDGTIASHAWDLDNDGAFDDATGPTASRTFSEGGAYTVRLRVTDDLGAWSVASQVINVASCEQTRTSAGLRNAAQNLDAAVELPRGVPHPKTEPVVRDVNCNVLYGTGV